jgi:hypothetical protein
MFHCFNRELLRTSIMQVLLKVEGLLVADKKIACFDKQAKCKANRGSQYVNKVLKKCEKHLKQIENLHCQHHQYRYLLPQQ